MVNYTLRIPVVQSDVPGRMPLVFSNAGINNYIVPTSWIVFDADGLPRFGDGKTLGGWRAFGADDGATLTANQNSEVNVAGSVVAFSGDDQRFDELMDKNRRASRVMVEDREIASVDTIDDVHNLTGIDVPGPIVRTATNPDATELPVHARAKAFVTPSGQEIVIDTVSNELRLSGFRLVEDADPPRITQRVPYGGMIYKDLTPTKYQLSGRQVQMTSSMTRTGSRYWVAWRADNNFAAEHHGNYIVIARSDDNFTTTTEHAVLDYPIPDGAPHHPYQLIDPMLWTDPEGSLWMFYSVALGQDATTGHVDGQLGAWAIVCTNPQAAKTTWSKPFRLNNWGDPRHPTKLRGEWYLPIDMWRVSADTPPIFPETAGPFLYKLDWKNKRITKVSKLPPNASDGINWSGFFETEYVEKENGDVMAVIRSASGATGPDCAVSTDSGVTWSGFSKLLSALGNYSGSRIWVDRTPVGGRLFVIYNNDLIRRSLTIAMSDDDGADGFPYRKMIEPITTSGEGPQLTYPVVTYGPAGEIWMTYDGGRIGSPRSIRVTKVIESEIVAGASVPEVHIISQRTGA